MDKEPDWEQINAKKRIEINLGQAKNQAVELLKLRLNRPSEDIWKEYKELVRQFFRLNCEMDDELLNFQQSQKSQDTEPEQKQEKHPNPQKE